MPSEAMGKWIELNKYYESVVFANAQYEDEEYYEEMWAEYQEHLKKKPDQ